jgi:hypothetical protein
VAVSAPLPLMPSLRATWTACGGMRRCSGWTIATGQTVWHVPAPKTGMAAGPVLIWFFRDLAVSAATSSRLAPSAPQSGSGLTAIDGSAGIVYRRPQTELITIDLNRTTETTLLVPVLSCPSCFTSTLPTKILRWKQVVAEDRPRGAVPSTCPPPISGKHRGLRLRSQPF